MRLTLNFQLEDFTRLMLISGVIGLTGQYFFLPLFVRKLKFHDAAIALIGRLLDIFQVHQQYKLMHNIFAILTGN